LNLSYSSVVNTGQNMPFVDGIPYGEGWNLNLPFISISTAALIKFDNEQMREYATNSNLPSTPDYTTNTSGNLARFTEFELKNTYGHLAWFTPYLNIPGVASGRLIFKYMREAKNGIKEGVSVFVLEKFDTYIEATFNGLYWTVYLPDGTTYTFNEILYAVTNPTNQRVADEYGMRLFINQL
jgi:hypothetical protein